MKNGFITFIGRAMIAGFLLFTIPIHSQRTLINSISWGEFDTPYGKEDLLDSILANPIYDTVMAVEIDYLPDFQTYGMLEFKIPGRSEAVYSFGQQIEFYSEEDFVWRGRITDPDGDMIVIEKEGDVYGYFYIDSLLTYELIDLGGHSNLLVKFKENFLDTARCGVGEEEDLEPFTNNGSGVTRDFCTEDTKNIRILVLFTPKAAKKIRPGQKANLFVHELNDALSNSDISMDEVHFEISGLQELSGFEETSSWHDDLITLKNMVLNSSPDMREDAGSDLVVLFVDGNYKDCTIVGNAFQQAPIGRPDFGFAIVEGDGANKYTFAHEVAHTLGCRHTWDQTQLPEYATGYYWKYDGRKRATIMAPANKTRILHFSNPDVEFDGHVTGFEDFQNNARKLRESNDSIADNFCFEPAMLAWISGPHKGHEDTIYTWCANALYCDEIDIYHWEISTDGITFSTYANNSSASCISIYLPTDYDLFIRLTVTCLDDQEVTTFSHIFNLDNEFIDPLVIFYTDVSSYEGSTIETLTVSPNPALGELTISFDLSKSAKVSIYRIDILGQSKLISQDYFDKGLNRIKDNNTVDLNGPYYYTLISDDETKTKKVIFK